MDYTVEYYEKDDGSRPAEEFIFSQDNVFLLYSMIQLAAMQNYSFIALLSRYSSKRLSLVK